MGELYVKFNKYMTDHLTLPEPREDYVISNRRMQYGVRDVRLFSWEIISLVWLLKYDPMLLSSDLVALLLNDQGSSLMGQLFINYKVHFHEKRQQLCYQ
jgi:hypothetical protein